MITTRGTPSATILNAPRLLVLVVVALAVATLSASAAYAASGDLVKWAPLHLGASVDRDALFSAAPGPDGSLYVCGISDQSNDHERMYLAKYDAGRDLVWQRTYVPPGAVTAGGSLAAVSASGDVVVAGHLWDGAQSDLAVAKFSADGTLLWSAVRHDAAAFGGAAGLAIAGDGSVYVADSGWGGPQISIVKYASGADPDHPGKGLERWRHTLSGGGASPSVDVRTLALDGGGNVYASGSRSSVGSAQDAFVLKLSPAGKRRWLRTWDGTRHGYDTVEHLVVRGKRVYAAGNTETKARQADMVLLVYDTGGHLRWNRRWDDGLRGSDNVGALRVDGAGNLYAAANTWLSMSRQKLFLCKYSPSGRLLWQRGYRGVTGAGGANATGLAVSKAGDAWVSGYVSPASGMTRFLTMKVAANGVRRWTRAWEGPPPEPLGGQAWGCILTGSGLVTYGELFTSANGSGAGLTWRRR